MNTTDLNDSLPADRRSSASAVSTLALLLALSSAAVAEAQTVTQTVNFEFTESYDVGAGSFEHVGDDFFTATFDPFDTSLGELQSFALGWDLSNTAIGNLGSGGGSVTLSYSGDLQLAGFTYEADLFATVPGGGPPGGALSLSAPLDATTLFSVLDAGVAFDQGILNAVTGESSFAAAFLSPINLSVSGSATFDATVAGSVNLTYNFVPSAVPEPSTYAAICGGLVLVGAILRRRRSGNAGVATAGGDGLRR